MEDNPAIRQSVIELMHDLLSVEVVAWSEDEKGSIDWLTNPKNGWDVAVVDMFLVQGNGLNVARSVQSRSSAQSVVVLTNYATPDIRIRCANFGVNAVFDKSKEIDEFAQFMHQVHEQLLN